MSKVENRDWAEDEDEDPLALPALEIKKNNDGTETQISYRWRDDGKKVKTTRVVKRSVVKRAVSPGIAERRAWPKFGMAAKDAPGPNPSTTSVGEDIVLVLRQGFKSSDNQGPGDAMSELDKKKQELKNTTVKCRICSGEHFTARCPFKGTMAPEGEPPAGEPAADPMAEVSGGGATGKSYVPPALRKGGGGVGEKMAGGGKYERDDLATLRVTNVSEWAEEGELRDIFERHGRVTRVFLAKDRETGRAKGFAFVSFADRDSAAGACAKVDGHGYNNLILRVEFAKKTT